MLVEPGAGRTRGHAAVRRGHVGALRPGVRARAEIAYDDGMRPWLLVLALLGALAAVMVGVVVLHRSFEIPARATSSTEGPAEGPAADTAAEDVIGRALRLAAIDTTRKRE